MLRARAAARLAGVVLAAAGLCAVTVAPARADAVRDQEMWVLDMVHAPSAWPVTQGQHVTVAVIDSGVFPTVSDLDGSVISGPNLSGVNTPQSNASWGIHGTWMASLIAGHGHGDGSSGIEGVAPASRVLSIRVVTDRGDPNFGKYEQESNDQVQGALARAITIATNRGAEVISMSLGYGAPSRVVRQALQYADDHGVVVVASSGNSGDTARARSAGQAPYSFPADYPGVLGVGAVTQTGSAATFSSDNLSVAVAAPGVKVPAQGRDGQYWLVSGTSPACALTAGVAALIKSRYPHLSPALVDQAITSSAQNPPAHGYDDRIGFGTVDAAAALTAAARLNRDAARGRGVKVAAHFGGGAGATSAVPVAPRGKGRLALYAFLMLVFVAIAVAAVARLIRRPQAATAGGGPRPGNRSGPASRPPRPDYGAQPANPPPPGYRPHPHGAQSYGSQSYGYQPHEAQPHEAQPHEAQAYRSQAHEAQAYDAQAQEAQAYEAQAYGSRSYGSQPYASESPGPRPRSSGQPGETQPDGPQSYRSRSLGPQPNGSQPDGPQSYRSRSYGPQPDGSQPDGPQSYRSRSYGPQPDGSRLGETDPDDTQPDGRWPDGERWPEQPGQWPAPAAQSARPGGAPAPEHRPDPSPWSVPPEQPPLDDDGPPGLPWPSPGP